MFGLPGLTALVLFGFPLFWIIYTIIFWVKTRNWVDDSENKGGNFFLVTNNRIRTPSTINCLDGISRQTIFLLAAQLGIPIEECQLLPYDVIIADEAFFTSTPYCIMPATKFNGIEIGDGKLGPITKKLLATWSEMVGVDIIEQAQAPSQN